MVHKHTSFKTECFVIICKFALIIVIFVTVLEYDKNKNTKIWKENISACLVHCNTQLSLG